MQLSFTTTVLLGLAAFASALPQSNNIIARQNAGRPVPNGQCCVANTNLTQDACTGGAGRCVPGGNPCECPPWALSSIFSRLRIWVIILVYGQRLMMMMMVDVIIRW